jgi:hypothetical protein
VVIFRSSLVPRSARLDPALSGTSAENRKWDISELR